MKTDINVEQIIATADAKEARLANEMPDDQAAINRINDAYQRLMNLGWNDPVYCPKDGTPFEVIEAGSTGIHKCVYWGEWPKGGWWIMADGDLWPSRPILFRKIKQEIDAIAPTTPEPSK